MLERIKSEIRMTVVYNVLFLVFASIHNNEGIDKYLLDEIVENLSVIPTLLGMSVVYLLLVYLYKVVAETVKKDLEQVKTELKKKKIEA